MSPVTPFLLHGPRPSVGQSLIKSRALGIQVLPPVPPLKGCREASLWHGALGVTADLDQNTGSASRTQLQQESS